MSIDKFQTEDTAEIMHLFYNTVHHATVDNYSSEQRAAWAPLEMLYDGKQIPKWQASLEENVSFVAKKNHQIVGFADLTKKGYLNRLYVHHHFQRQGIASKLLIKIENAARHRHQSILETDASITAKPFFEKHGFQLIQEQTVYRYGIALINYKMRKLLLEQL